MANLFIGYYILLGKYKCENLPSNKMLITFTSRSPAGPIREVTPRVNFLLEPLVRRPYIQTPQILARFSGSTGDH
jgi:hypothetical protein